MDSCLHLILIFEEICSYPLLLMSVLYIFLFYHCTKNCEFVPVWLGLILLAPLATRSMVDQLVQSCPQVSFGCLWKSMEKTKYMYRVHQNKRVNFRRFPVSFFVSVLVYCSFCNDALTPVKLDLYSINVI